MCLLSNEVTAALASTIDQPQVTETSCRGPVAIVLVARSRRAQLLVVGGDKSRPTWRLRGVALALRKKSCRVVINN